MKRQYLGPDEDAIGEIVMDSRRLYHSDCPKARRGKEEEDIH